MEYKLICSDSLDYLELTVNKFLGMGWTLQGGTSISHVVVEKDGYTENDREYCQAVVRPSR